MTNMTPVALGLAALLALAGCANQVQAPMAVSQPAAPVQVFAAGSLRGALNAVASDYEARTGQKIALTYGPSGLLRERLEKAKRRSCLPRPTRTIRSAWSPRAAGRHRLFLCATACAH